MDPYSGITPRDVWLKQLEEGKTEDDFEVWLTRLKERIERDRKWHLWYETERASIQHKRQDQQRTERREKRAERKDLHQHRKRKEARKESEKASRVLDSYRPRKAAKCPKVYELSRRSAQLEECTEEDINGIAERAFERLQGQLKKQVASALSEDSLDAALVQEYVLNKNFPDEKAGFSGQECLSFSCGEEEDVGRMFVSMNYVNLLTSGNAPRAKPALNWLANKHNCKVVVVMAGRDFEKHKLPHIKSSGKNRGQKGEKGVCLHTEIKNYTHFGLPKGISKHCCFFCASLLFGMGVQASTHGGVYQAYPFPFQNMHRKQIAFFFGEEDGAAFVRKTSECKEAILNRLNHVALERKKEIPVCDTSAKFDDMARRFKEGGLEDSLHSPSKVRFLTFVEDLDEFQPEYDESGEVSSSGDDELSSDEESTGRLADEDKMDISD